MYCIFYIDINFYFNYNYHNILLVLCETEAAFTQADYFLPPQTNCTKMAR